MIDFYPRPLRGGRHIQNRGFRVGQKISIHALCEEGDADGEAVVINAVRFLSTPSARRATRSFWQYRLICTISIHALCEEGDKHLPSIHRRQEQFLSTPSARRATIPAITSASSSGISIHALCEEGDRLFSRYAFTFSSFLSTPSARRATAADRFEELSGKDFYPRPLRGGRPFRF